MVRDSAPLTTQNYSVERGDFAVDVIEVRFEGMRKLKRVDVI